MVIKEFFWGNREPLSASDTRELARFSSGTVKFLRLAYLIEGKSRGLIDFDLAPEDEYTKTAEEYDVPDWAVPAPPKAARLRIVAGLRRIKSRVDSFPVPKNPRIAMQQQFFSAKLQALITFNRLKAGEEIDNLEYIEETMGIEPQTISESRLEEQKGRVVSIFSNLGHHYTRKSIEEFRKQEEISVEEVPTAIRKHAMVFLQELGEFIGKKIDPNYLIQTEDKEKEYWFFWATGKHNRFKITFNTNERHRHKLTKSKIEAMAAHEIAGHLGQMHCWQEASDDKELLEPLGVTSVYDPEQVSSEGIAQTLHYFIPGIAARLSKGALFELEIEGLRQMVYNNIHIMVNTDPNYKNKDIISYVRKYLPAESRKEIGRQISERKRDDVKRTYLYSYGIGFARHQWYAMNLSEAGKEELIAKLLYRQPTTPTQEHGVVLGLLNHPSKRYGKINQTYEDFIGISSDSAA